MGKGLGQIRKFEYGNGVHEFPGLILQALGRRSALLYQRCVLLSHAIHLTDSDGLPALHNPCEI
jgi:hypothetical protein